MQAHTERGITSSVQAAGLDRPTSTFIAIAYSLSVLCGQIYVLDMGRPVHIAHLARDIIRLSGFSEEQIRIEYTGLRPGEKFYQEVIEAAETLLDTPHPQLRVAQARAVALGEVERVIDQLQRTPTFGDVSARATLERLVPEYAASPAAQIAESGLQPAAVPAPASAASA